MIKIGFATSDAFISRAIRWATRSKVSHTFILVEDDPRFHDDMVVQAIWCGWQVTTRKQFESGSRIIELVAPAVSIDKGFDIAIGWLNTPYAYRGIVGMMWVCLGRLFHRVWLNPLPDPHHMFCSEAIFYLLQACAYPGAADVDPPSASPEDLQEFLHRPVTP